MRSYWMVVVFMGAVVSALAGEKPFPQLPELAPPATDPVDLDTLNGLARAPDAEAIIAFFAKHQARLSDYQRVELLSRAILPYEHAMAGTPNFWNHGPLRPLLGLALKAARGAENQTTLRLREMRVHIAQRLGVYVGLREATNFHVFLEKTDFKKVALLGTVEALGLRRKLLKYLNDPAQVKRRRERLENAIGQVFSDPFDDYDKEKAKEAWSVREVIAWLDEHEVPTIEEIPYRSPHDADFISSSRTFATLEELHEQHVLEFVGSPGFGMTRESPRDTRHRYDDPEGKQWVGVQSSLISFLDRPEPLAYEQKRGLRQPLTMGNTVEMALEIPPPSGAEQVAAAVKSMQEPQPSLVHRTRPLMASEVSDLERALASLKPVMQTSEERLEIVAPIIAQASCVRCHDVEKGEALGAFSYVLEPFLADEKP